MAYSTRLLPRYKYGYPNHEDSGGATDKKTHKMDGGKFPPNTLAYFLLKYYKIHDPTASSIVLSPREIKVMEGKVIASKIPKAFRRSTRSKRRTGNNED